MKSAALKIIGEELKKEGLEIAEEVLEKTVDTIMAKALPRIVLEDPSAADKSVAGVILTLWPAVKPMVDKATDLNHDGN